MTEVINIDTTWIAVAAIELLALGHILVCSYVTLRVLKDCGEKMDSLRAEAQRLRARVAELEASDCSSGCKVEKAVREFVESAEGDTPCP